MRLLGKAKEGTKIKVGKVHAGFNAKLPEKVTKRQLLGERRSPRRV